MFTPLLLMMATGMFNAGKKRIKKKYSRPKSYRPKRKPYKSHLRKKGNKRGRAR